MYRLIPSVLKIFTGEMRGILKDINLQSRIGAEIIIEHAIKVNFALKHKITC